MITRKKMSKGEVREDVPVFFLPASAENGPAQLG
jgi:hypothetical protein